MLSNIDSDLNLYICIGYQFTGFNAKTKRLRPCVTIHGVGIEAREEKQSKSSGSDYQVKFMTLLN